jgi:hypothetical protein
MALQLAISTQYGIDLPSAYAKISHFNGTKDYFAMYIEYYATLYTYLKTLPEFAGALDC